MSTRPSLLTLVIAVLTVALTIPGQSWAIGFQPVSPDELKMTSEPKAPGAPAIILFREVDRDDRGLTAHEDDYFRIKILTEEGRKYADIEIPYFNEEGKIGNIHARTIQPDGTVINFNGKVFDKTIIKARGLKYLAKTFTLPNVQVGSILEYFYTEDLSEKVIVNSHWIVNHELFTRDAKFTLKPYTSDDDPVRVHWSWNMLPAGSEKPTQGPDKVVRFEAANIAAFQAEDYMPPENELKFRVDFIYSEDAFESQPDRYWKKFGKKKYDQMESFVGKRKAMEEAVSQIVSPSDSQEVKLRKIYARVQQIRNTSYEAEKTEQEQQRAKEKAPDNVEAIWKKQYGSGWQLTWLFLGLARAAGFEATGMWLADRQNYFFLPQAMDSNRLDANVVIVKLSGKDSFFDPGAAFTPFGGLPWVETQVKGLKLDKDGGTWVDTPLPASAESAVQRKAELKFSADTGELEGKLTVTYTGLEASQRRVEERLADGAERKKYLEDEVKEAVPIACDVELINQPDWKSSDPSLVAEFTFKITGWVSAAGRRALLPMGLFSAPEKHLFDHESRTYPIYFQFPFQRSDDISIELPLGWQISTVPQPQNLDAKAITYSIQGTNEKGTLHVTRVLNVDVFLLAPDVYPNLRRIFQTVRTDDEQQVILQPGASTASN